VQQVVELHNAQIALTQSRFDHGLLAIVTFAAIAAPVAIKKIEPGASRDNHNEQNS
jgi:two-component system sensor histidine kinase QseC